MCHIFQGFLLLLFLCLFVCLFESNAYSQLKSNRTNRYKTKSNPFLLHPSSFSQPQLQKTPLNCFSLTFARFYIFKRGMLSLCGFINFICGLTMQRIWVGHPYVCLTFQSLLVLGVFALLPAKSGNCDNQILSCCWLHCWPADLVLQVDCVCL